MVNVQAQFAEGRIENSLHLYSKHVSSVVFAISDLCMREWFMYEAQCQKYKKDILRKHLKALVR